MRKTLLVAIKVNGEQIRSPGNKESRCGLGVSISSTEDALSEVDSCAIRCNIEEFSGEVGVQSRGCSKEFEADGAR